MKLVLSSKLIPAIAAACAMLFGPAQAQQNFDKVEIKVEKLSPTTYVLFGAGGNIGVSAGEDALFIIDRDAESGSEILDSS